MKRALIYQILILLSLSLGGQDINLSVEYPSVVVEGQQFSIIWNVNSGGGEFAAPSFSPFSKLMGPQTSYSSSTQIVNGKMKQFSWILPRKPGESISEQPIMISLLRYIMK